MPNQITNLSTIFRTIVETHSQVVYYGILGRISAQRKSRYLRMNCNDRQETRTTIEEESTTVITVPFLRRALEIRLANSIGCVSRSLAVFAILPLDAPVFEMCRAGNIKELQSLFTNKCVSPFVQSKYGLTLLHVCPKPLTVVKLFTQPRSQCCTAKVTCVLF